jgi:hypothetical protein
MDFDDHDLRSRFAALAEELRAATPVLARDRIDAHRSRLAARRARLARYSVGGLTTLVAAAAVAVAMWTESDVRELPITNWVAPTDFLLHTPGTDLLGSMPINTPPVDLAPPTAADVRRDTSGE